MPMHSIPMTPIPNIMENSSNTSSLSPASVADNTDTELDTSAVKSMNINPPPVTERPKIKMRQSIARSQSERIDTTFHRSSSMPNNDNDDDEGNPLRRRRRSIDSGSLADHFKHDASVPTSTGTGNLTINDSTVRILKQMSSNQLEVAHHQLSKVREQRRQSGLLDMGAANKKRLSMIMEMDSNEDRRGSQVTCNIGDSCSSTSRRRSSNMSVGASMETMPEGIEDELAAIEGTVVKRGTIISKGGMGNSDSKQRTKRLSDPVKIQPGDAISRGASSASSRGSSAKSDRRQYSKSVGCIDTEPLDEEDDSSDELDDSEDMDESARIAAFEGEKDLSSCDLTKLLIQNESNGKVDMGADGGQNENNASDHNRDDSDVSEGLAQVLDIVDETFSKIVREHSQGKEGMGDASSRKVEGNDTSAAAAGATSGSANEALNDAPQSTDFKPLPLYEHRRPTARARRQGIMPSSNSSGASMRGKDAVSSSWKPLSSAQQDLEPEEIDDEIEKEELGSKRLIKDAGKKPQGGGLGGFWNKLTASFTSESSPITEKTLLGAPSSPTPAAPKKEINGATYFRRGKRRANKCQFLQAVALYNFALVRQREELGENHIDCGTTLNEIGVCWMMLGERYPALTAFEEALFIRQKHLGDGAMEVAEITNNIWMILHEERAEMEVMMEEREEDDGEE